MYIYLASRYSRRQEMVGYADELRALGHIITSRWITGKHETLPGIDEDATEEEKCAWATEDVGDVFASTALISFTENGRNVRAGRGGRHVEFGIAIGFNEATHPSAQNIRLIVVGPREHIFHCLEEVEQYTTWGELIAQLEEEMR